MSEAPRTTEFRIVGREDFSGVTFSLVIRHPMMAKAARPGQFVIVMSHEAGERIPLAIADFDRNYGTITLVIQAVGKTTKEMQQACQAGRLAPRACRPDGRSKPDRRGEKSCMRRRRPWSRAGFFPGVRLQGVRRLRDRRARLPHQGPLFWREKFGAICDELNVCTDDGSAGLKGLVSHGVQLAIDHHPDIDKVVAIGPPLMMQACAETTRPYKIKTIVSLNPIMVDGTGMCGGCRVKVGDEAKFACVDGPDFDGHKVDFADLMTRLKRYADEERTALKKWSESCRMPAPAA